MLIFTLLAALLLLAAAAVVWLKSPRHAAYALLGAFLAGTALVAWLQATFLALALLLALVGGSALLFMVGLPLLARLGPLAESRPDEDRSFWAGIVAVLFFVITYRVIATTTWGAQDHSVLSEATRGLEAIGTLGAALRAEYALALLASGFLVVVTIAVAAAMSSPETDA